MESFVLTIHIFLAIAITLLVLMQRSEGGALGGLGGNANATSFLTGRQAGNVLSKATAILFFCFIATSLILVILAKQKAKENTATTSIIPLIQNQVEEES